MFELMLCSLFTLVPDYMYRRYVQGKRLGKEIKVLRVAAKIISEEEGGETHLDLGSDSLKSSDPGSPSDNQKARWP